MVISVIPLLVSGVVLFFLLKTDINDLDQQLTAQISDELTREISYKNEAIAKTEGLYVEQELDRIGNKLNTVALSPDMINMNTFGINAYLENLLASEPAILEVTVVDKFGSIVYNKVNSFSLLSEEPADLAQQEIFKALERKESYVSNVEISSRTQLPYVTLGQPIVQFGGNFEGGIIVNLDLNFIWNIVADKEVGENGFLYIISSEGQLISHPSKKELYQNSDYAKYEHIQEIIANKNGTLTKGNELVSYYTNKYNWTTIIEIPTDKALASVAQNQLTIRSFISDTFRSIGLTTGAVIFLVLIIAVFASILVTRQIIKPITQLTQATQLVAAGDLEMEIRKTTNDEVGQLTDSFNAMTQELRRKQEELLKSNDYIKKQAEELLDRYNSDLEQFAYVTTHDLIEPLRMITSYTQLLKRRYGKELPEEASDFMGFVVEGVERMHAIINDLFEYSHIRTNIKDFEVVDCLEVFDFVMGKMSKEIQENKVSISCSDMPKTKAVFSNMVQIFQNLIGNAIKFKKEDEALTIDIKAEDIGDEWLFSFADNGIGIDPTYKDKIFEIFKRLNKRDKYPGSGMGLAICKNIIERHGGKIWVESELGEGSTFYFTIKKY